MRPAGSSLSRGHSSANFVLRVECTYLQYARPARRVYHTDNHTVSRQMGQAVCCVPMKTSRFDAIAVQGENASNTRTFVWHSRAVLTRFRPAKPASNSSRCRLATSSDIERTARRLRSRHSAALSNRCMTISVLCLPRSLSSGVSCSSSLTNLR